MKLFKIASNLCSSALIRVPLMFFVFCFSFAATATAAQFTLLPRTSVQTEYNDNIFRDSEPERAVADYITSASVGFSGSAATRTTGLNISYDPAYKFYANNSEINRWNHYANGLAWWEMAKNTRLELKDTFSVTEDPSRDDDYTVRRGRFLYTNNDATARLSHQFGLKDNVYVDYAYRLQDNESPFVEDRNTHNPSLGLAYWFTPAWGVDISGGYTKGTYDGITDDFDNYTGTLRLIHAFSKHFSTYVEYTHIERNYIGLTEDYKVYDPSAGINWDIEDDFSVNLGIGYFVQDKQFSQDDSGIVIDLDIDKEWATRRTRFNISGFSGYDQPDFGSENLGFSLFYETGATLTYGFTRFFSANVNGFHRSDEYIDSFPKRTDKNNRAGAGLTWRALKWCNLRLDYRYNTLDSTIETRDYVENKVTFRIELSPSVPHRF